MTDPVEAVNGAKAIGKKGGRENSLKRNKTIHSTARDEDDSVEISQEARDRASGKKRRNILEYLEDEGAS